MKKFAKVCGIIIGICLGLGILLCGIACLIGGTQVIREVKLHGNINNWVDSIETAVDDWGILDTHIVFSPDFTEGMQEFSDSMDDFCEMDFDGTAYDNMGADFENAWEGDWTENDWNDGYSEKELYINGKQAETSEKIVIDADQVEDIYVLLGAGRLKIRETDEKDISLYIEGTGNTKYDVTDGKLSIQGFYKGSNSTTIENKSRRNIIILELPKGTMLKSIDLLVGAGIVSADEINADQANVELGAGGIEIDALQLTDMNVTVGAGEIDLNNLQTENLVIDVAMGSCDIEGAIKGNLNASCAMGTIEAKLSGNKEDHNYILDCAAGTVTIDHDSVSQLGIGKNIDNASDSTYTLQCQLGTIELSFE